MAVLLHHEYGIVPGGSVATLLINHPYTIAIYFAAWRLGARVVPINPGETDERVEYIFTNSESTLLVAHESCRDCYNAIHNAMRLALIPSVLDKPGSNALTLSSL